MDNISTLLRDTEFNLRIILYTGSESDKSDLDLTNHNFIYSNPSFFSILNSWLQVYKERDFEEFERNGLTEEIFQTFLEKIIPLRKITSFPYEENSTSSKNIISIIFYKYNSKLVIDACNQLSSILNEYDSPLKEKAKIISHEWIEDQNLPTEKNRSISIDNPFVLFKDAIGKISVLLKTVNNLEEIDFNNFKYNEKFQILKSFENDIKSIDLQNDEIEELLYNWSVIFLKGYALSQIFFIPSEEDKLEFEKERHKAQFSNDEIDTYINIKTFQAIGKIILECAGDIHEDKLNEISQKHPNDLKPFFDELIPAYKFIISPEGLIKITIEMSKHVGPVIDKEYEYAKRDWKYGYWDNNIAYSSYIFSYYLDLIPFELNDPPGKNYTKLFNDCLYLFNYSTCFNAFMRINNTILATFDLEEIDGELDNLQIQKYYLIWYMVTYIRQKAKYYLDISCRGDDGSFAALVLSIIPWRINSNCEEARTLEDMLHKNIIKAVRDRRSPYPYTWYNYIQKIWNINTPLNVDEMKKKMNPEDPSNPKQWPKEDSFEGCCLIS